jgi:hypothetical protein
VTVRKPEKAITKALSDLASTSDARKRLQIVRDIENAVNTLEQQAVLNARAKGVTWSEIGRVYGMTKQAAQQRFRSRRVTPLRSGGRRAV